MNHHLILGIDMSNSIMLPIRGHIRKRWSITPMSSHTFPPMCMRRLSRTIDVQFIQSSSRAPMSSSRQPKEPMYVMESPHRSESLYEREYTACHKRSSYRPSHALDVAIPWNTSC